MVDFVDEAGGIVSLRKWFLSLCFGDLRLNAQYVAQPPCLVPVLPVCLADGIDVVDAQNPLVLGELDLADEVVEVPDQRGEHFAVARLCLRGHQVDDILGEVGVEAGAAVGRHCDWYGVEMRVGYLRGRRKKLESALENGKAIRESL